MNWTSWGDPAMAAPEASPIVFLPGWGCSGRMLSLCAPERPWWSVADQIYPSALAADLEMLLANKGWQRIILVGWSLGARLALEFASRYPGSIEALVLLSLRRDWPEQEIAGIHRDLQLDQAAFLKDFYRKCFLGYKKAWRQFVDQQLESEIRSADFNLLDAGLALLQTPQAPTWQALKLSGLTLSRVWLLHGENDIIAPFQERAQLPGARQIALKHEGHALFLSPLVRGLSFLRLEKPGK